MSLAPWTSAAEGGGILFTASPRRGEEEHVPKGEERRGVAVPPRIDESAGEDLIDLGGHKGYLQSLNFLAENGQNFQTQKPQFYRICQNVGWISLFTNLMSS